MGAVDFEQYAREHTRSLLGLAGALCGDRHTAEDVVQEVLTRAASRWDSISVARSPDAYVRRMVVNEYRSWRRKWARIVPRLDLAAMVGADAAVDHAERHAETDAMRRRLATLPPRQRAVLVLRYYEDLADRDIAEILGCSRATVRSHAARALRQLKIADPAPLAVAPTEDDRHE